MQKIKLRERIQYKELKTIQDKRDVSTYKIFVYTVLLAVGTLIAVGIIRLAEKLF